MGFVLVLVLAAFAALAAFVVVLVSDVVEGDFAIGPEGVLRRHGRIVGAFGPIAQRPGDRRHEVGRHGHPGLELLGERRGAQGAGQGDQGKGLDHGESLSSDNRIDGQTRETRVSSLNLRLIRRPWSGYPSGTE
jgi:hypothetical protein